MDIVICMSREDFQHKMGKDVYHCYWSMGRRPKYFYPACNSENPDAEGDKVFIVTESFIEGFITPEEFNADDDWETIVWDGGNDFTYIERLPFRPFRGFRYRKFNYKLMKKYGINE